MGVGVRVFLPPLPPGVLGPLWAQGPQASSWGILSSLQHGGGHSQRTHSVWGLSRSPSHTSTSH